MPPRSAAPAIPRSGAGSPQTKSAAGDHGPRPERQTGTRTSRLEPRTDQSPRSPRHGCAGTSARSATAAVCTENSIRIDWEGNHVTLAHNDRAVMVLANVVRFAVEVEEPS